MEFSRLAETLLPLIAKKPEEAVPEAQKIIETFETHYQKTFRAANDKKKLVCHFLNQEITEKFLIIYKNSLIFLRSRSPTILIVSEV